MKLRVHRPKLLAMFLWAIFLLVTAALIGMGILFAPDGDEKEITFTPIPRAPPLVSGSLEGGDDREITFTPIQQTGTPLPTVSDEALQEALLIAKASSITTSVQGGMWGDARMAARRLAWERRARSLLSCVSCSHRSNSSGPNRSRGSISRTTR